jgi:hypothetical protein
MAKVIRSSIHWTYPTIELPAVAGYISQAIATSLAHDNTRHGHWNDFDIRFIMNCYMDQILQLWLLQANKNFRHL